MAMRRTGAVIPMAKNTGMDLYGADDLILAIKRLGDDVQGVHLRTATEAGAKIVSTAASTLAPRSEFGSRGNPAGHLSKSIRTQVKWTSTQDVARVDVGMLKSAWYGQLQERGTAFHPAQPFMRPALAATTHNVVALVSKILRARILQGKV